ncbi:MAG: Gfo/Idh/MocA family oxidoreductase [Pirellulaceae bacterium]|jgi:predicted dehydrogenase|nr:Gfo/Idh/MocA family oxidoreductase [Thermoguttaceae bacterium]MDI9443260.1 Gfo/Idh/MocA family oxidoreductase [Planctomycetota bacterium]NLY98991.1 Gfo/Idh/MocA family oxidoreductase [Pirellulaceae bacterium]
MEVSIAANGGGDKSPRASRRRFLQAAIGAGLALGRSGRVVCGAPPGQRRVRVGLIGTDGHTGVILGAIPRVAGVELAAFAKSLPDDDAAGMRRNKAFSEKTRIYDEFEPMLEEEELDVVAVCLPYYRNAEASLAAARKGIHIVSEKPVATTLESLAALKKAVAKSGVRLTSLMNMRCFPPYRAARQAVEDGLVGEPILLTSQKSYKFGGGRPWFYKDLETYGGTIPWAGIHSIDYMRWTSGRKYVRVSAWHGNKAHPDYPGFQDHAGLLFTLDNGGTAMSNLDYLRPETAPTHGDDRLRIAGSEGVVEVIGSEERAVVVSAGAGPRDLELPEPVDFFTDFLAELAGEGEHLISQADAFRLTEICLKARQAAQADQWIDL